jgi:hypothetical protein
MERERKEVILVQVISSEASIFKLGPDIYIFLK